MVLKHPLYNKCTSLYIHQLKNVKQVDGTMVRLFSVYLQLGASEEKLSQFEENELKLV